MVKKFSALDEGLNDFKIDEDKWENLTRLISISDRRWLTAIVGSYIAEKRVRSPSEMRRYVDRIERSCASLIRAFDPEKEEIPAEVFGAFIQAWSIKPEQEFRDCLDQFYKLMSWCGKAKKHLPPARTDLQLRVEFLCSINVFVCQQRGEPLRNSRNGTADRKFVKLLFSAAGETPSEWEVEAAMSGALKKPRTAGKSAAKKSTAIAVS